LIGTFFGGFAVRECELKAEGIMSAHTVEEATIVEAAVSKALADAGVAEDSPIGRRLIADAEVYDLVETCVPSAIDGRSVSLEQRLAEMKVDDRWKSEFKAKPAASRPHAAAATPAGAMLTPDRSHFEDIVSGKAVVR
jgi:hypothetical protein